MAAEDLRNPTILIVEDDADVRRVLGALLENGGFDVRLAGSCAAAVEIYRREQASIDLVLLDVQMPGQDGVATLGQLRALNPGMVAVFITGNSGKYSEQDLLDRGAATVLQKPPEMTELQEVLWDLVRRAARPGVASSAAPANRRNAVRRQPPLGTVCRLDPGEGQKPNLGLVWNLSTNGVSMLLREPPQGETVFPAELTTVNAQGSLPITLQVVYVRPVCTGDYCLGAQFERPLATEELHSFLAGAAH